MRLTLRTMLAYLDDVLDADDAAELGHKIEDSEFASGLVQRIRNCTTRPQVEALPVEGQGMGKDPNTVAEYLDNTLPAERMPDFERVCLESDMHLAEAAACHQVLTLVLGEPASVPQQTRQRMYRLGAHGQPAAAPPVEEPRVEEPAVAASSVPAADAPMPARKSGRKRPEVPDYLKTRSPLRYWPLAVALLLIVGLGGAAYKILGTDFLNNLRGGSTTQFAANDNGEKEVGRDESQADEGATDEQPTQPLQDEEQVEERSTTGDTGEPGDVAEGVAATADDTVTSDERPVAPLPPLDGAEESVGGAEQPTGTESEADTPSDERLAMNGRDIVPGSADAIPGVTVDTPPAAAAGQSGELGRYTSDRKEVLLRFDPEQGVWMRMPSRSLLSVDDVWLALPAYRPQLALASGVQLTLDGPARLRMLEPEADGTPHLSLDYGKAIIVGIGQPGARVALRLGDRDGELVLVDGGSTCAVEVVRIHPAGTNPEEVPAAVVSWLYCTSGSVNWIDAQGNSQIVMAGGMREMVDDRPATLGSYNEVPAWVGGNHLSEPDKMGSNTLEGFLEDDRPADLSLLERASDRRAEVRALAARSLCYLGTFDAAINALNDSGQRAYWASQFDALRDAISRGPQTAGVVRLALERNRGQDASALYRMLWGYQQADLEGGAAAELVATLENENLDMRVLALENLMRITGVSLQFRPDAPEGARRTPLRSWQERLQEGSIRYKDAEPPSEPAGDLPAGGPDSGLEGVDA